MNNKAKPIHLFVVHSSITLAVTNAIIKALALKKDEVMLLSMREFKVMSNFLINEFPEFKIENIFNFLANKKKLIAFDTAINRVTGGRKYFLYVPHLLLNSFYLLSSNKSCLNYNFIEEGMASYIDYQSINETYKTTYKSTLHRLLIPFFLRLGFGSRLLSDRKTFDCENHKYQQSFGFFEQTFPGFNAYTQVEPAFNYNKIDYSHVKHVLIVGMEIEVAYVDQAVYLEMLQKFKLIFENARGNEQLYYKLHPGQSKQCENAILEILEKENKGNIIQLSNEVSLEHLAAESQANFYGLISSAGFYASLLGRKVYSFCNIIKVNESLKEKMQLFPKIYFDLISHPDSVSDLTKLINNDKKEIEKVVSEKDKK